MATSDLETPSAPHPAAADPLAQTLALLQPWIDYVPQPQRRLGLFIFLAFLVHFLAFFFIRIDTTRAELRRQARPHITVENSATATMAGQPSSDDFTDQLSDPRLFLLPQEPAATPASGAPPLDFIALNSSIGSHEFPAPAPPGDYQFVRPILPSLDERIGDALHPDRQPFTYTENPPAIAAQTTWQSDADLAARHPASFPGLPSPTSDTELSPTQLRVAVDASGTVQHVLVDQTARLDLDQMASLAALKIRFQPTAKEGLLWGRLTVFWRYAAKPSEEVLPTPPSAP